MSFSDIREKFILYGARSEQPLKKGCVRSCGCSVTRFSDFPTAMLLSKIATYGSLPFETSKKTKGGNAA